MLTPAHFDASVVDREAVQLAHGEELRRGDGVYECDETHVALLQEADALKQAATHHVADLLDGQVLMQVAQVNGAVAQVVGAAGLGGNLRRRGRLLHQRQRDVFAVGRGDNVLHAGGQPQVLCGVVLLRLGDEGAAVLAVEAFFVQVFVLQRQVGHASNGAQNGQKVDEGNALLGDNLDAVNHPVGGQVRPQLRLSDHLARERVVQIAQVDIARGAVALNQLGHHRQDRRVLAPPDANVVAVDVELLQDAVRVKQQRRLVVDEGDKGAVFGGQDLHQLEDPRPHVVKELVGLDVAGDVAEVHRARRCHGRGKHLSGVGIVRGGVLARAVLRRLGWASGVLMVLLLMLLMVLMLLMLMLLMMQVVQLHVLRMQMLLRELRRVHRGVHPVLLLPHVLRVLRVLLLEQTLNVLVVGIEPEVGKRVRRKILPLRLRHQVLLAELLVGVVARQRVGGVELANAFEAWRHHPVRLRVKILLRVKLLRHVRLQYSLERVVVGHGHTPIESLKARPND